MLLRLTIPLVNLIIFLSVTSAPPERKAVETLNILAKWMMFSAPVLFVFPVRKRLSRLSLHPIFNARSV